jgi:hypothetical protein
MVSRFRQRLFQPWSGPRAPAVAQPPEAVAKRKMSFQASIAEFLLVNRLRARRRAAAFGRRAGACRAHCVCHLPELVRQAGPGSPDHRTRL